MGVTNRACSLLTQGSKKQLQLDGSPIRWGFSINDFILRFNNHNKSMFPEKEKYCKNLRNCGNALLYAASAHFLIYKFVNS